MRKRHQTRASTAKYAISVLIGEILNNACHFQNGGHFYSKGNFDFRFVFLGARNTNLNKSKHELSNLTQFDSSDIENTDVFEYEAKNTRFPSRV